MPYKFDGIPINNPENDKRVKLRGEDRNKIREEYATGLVSQRDLARKYNVSRRTIQFILDPEKRERAKKQFAARQKDGRYYSKEKHRVYMKNHRDHLKQLYQDGKLKREEDN